MNKTFKTFANRKDASLVGFSADDNAALLQTICTNSATSNIRQLREGGAVSVPVHTVDQVCAHLLANGYTAA